MPLLQVCESPSFLWNYKEMLALLDKFPNVVATLGGHDHDGMKERKEETKRERE